jgi:cytochrome b561
MSVANEGNSVPEHYAPLAKWLHWIIALLVIGMIPAGIAMANIQPGPLQDRLYMLHRSTGLLILALAIVRLFVRVGYGAPPPYAGLTRFERIASTATHHLLYMLLFFMPIVGWLMASAFGATTSFYGLFDMPNLVGKNEALFNVLQKAHFFGGIAMALLIFMHIGGALMHTFIKRDIVLWRMLPRNWS